MNSPGTEWRRHFACLVFAASTALVGAQPIPTPLWNTPAHDSHLTSLDISPDGAWVLSGSRDNQLKLWNVADGSPLRTLGNHGDWITDAAFSPDGTLVASRGSAGTLKLWRVSDGTELRTISGVQRNGGFIASVAFSPDGTLLAAGRSGTNQIGLWRVADGGLEKTLNSSGSGLESAVFSPDGTLLAAGGGYRGIDTTIKIWRMADGALIKVLPTQNAYGLGQLAFSPDGTLLVVGTDPYQSFFGGVEIWKVSDWTVLHRLPVKGDFVSFSPDGALLALTRRNPNAMLRELDLWRVRDGTLLRAFRDSSPSNTLLEAVEFSRSGSQLIVASEVYSNTVNGTQIRGFIRSYRVPPVISSASRTSTHLTLDLSGGSGTFQIQQTSDLFAGWTNVGGPVSGRQLSFPTSGPQNFFRVIEAP